MVARVTDVKVRPEDVGEALRLSTTRWCGSAPATRAGEGSGATAANADQAATDSELQAAPRTCS
jgi:hypothetical protein